MGSRWSDGGGQGKPLDEAIERLLTFVKKAKETLRWRQELVLVLESGTHDLPGATIARDSVPQMRMSLAALHEAAV